MSPATDRLLMTMQTMLAPKELKAVHPLGKSPVITDGDLTVAESGKSVARSICKRATQCMHWVQLEGCQSPPGLGGGVHHKQLQRCSTFRMRE